MNFRRKRGRNTGQSKQRQRREKELFKIVDRRRGRYEGKRELSAILSGLLEE